MGGPTPGERRMRCRAENLAGRVAYLEPTWADLKWVGRELFTEKPQATAGSQSDLAG